jgi:hypothetical protein
MNNGRYSVSFVWVTGIMTVNTENTTPRFNGSGQSTTLRIGGSADGTGAIISYDDQFRVTDIIKQNGVNQSPLWVSNNYSLTESPRSLRLFSSDGALIKTITGLNSVIVKYVKIIQILYLPPSLNYNFIKKIRIQSAENGYTLINWENDSALLSKYGLLEFKWKCKWILKKHANAIILSHII